MSGGQTEKLHFFRHRADDPGLSLKAGKTYRVIGKTYEAPDDEPEEDEVTDEQDSDRIPIEPVRPLTDGELSKLFEAGWATIRKAIALFGRRPS